jgi:hypothetical protein
MEEKITPAEYSLKYTLPCFNNLVHRKALNKETAIGLEKMLLEKKKISRAYLETCFPDYFRRLKEVAKEMGVKNYWSIPVIRKYWLEEHNRFIDAGDGEYALAPASFKDLCKVHIAQVISKEKKKVGKERDILIVKYDNTERRVWGTLIPDAKPGNLVTIHIAYAVEKI